MDNFIYYAPTKIYFGTNNLENIVTEIKSRNYKKILTTQQKSYKIYEY